MCRKSIRDVKVTIQDYELLKQIQPETIITYLEAYDWAPVRSYAGLVSYSKTYLGTNATVTVPKATTATSYPQYVAALINQVSVVDGRSPLRTLIILAGNLIEVS